MTGHGFFKWSLGGGAWLVAMGWFFKAERYLQSGAKNTWLAQVSSIDR